MIVPFRDGQSLAQMLRLLFGLKSATKSEAYLEPCQTSKMECFAKSR